MDFSITVSDPLELTVALNRYKKKIDDCLSELLDVMAEKGEYYAIVNMLHIDTGETLDSIVARRRKGSNKAYIIAGGAAIWIEFGTGVAKNAGSEHPEVVSSPIPIYSHGEYGDGNGKHTYGWWYYDKNKKLHHTKGIKQNMFLWQTYQKLLEIYPELAEEVFK